jgi:hypothetical protein
MFSEITTTITTKIDLDTFEPSHTVEIAHGDELPEQIVLAAAAGGCKSSARTIEAKLNAAWDFADDDESDDEPLFEDEPALDKHDWEQGQDADEQRFENEGGR